MIGYEEYLVWKEWALNYSLIKSSWFYQWQERSSVSMYPVPGCWHQSPTWSQWILVQLQLVPASHEFIFLYLSFDLIFLIFNPDVPNISFLIYPPHSHRKETKKVQIMRNVDYWRSPYESIEVSVMILALPIPNICTYNTLYLG